MNNPTNVIDVSEHKTTTPNTTTPNTTSPDADGQQLHEAFDGATEVDEGPEPLDPKRLKRNPLLTRGSWLLVGALVACLAFALGARSKESSSSGLPAGFPSGGLAALAGGGGLGGAPGAGGAGGLPNLAALLGGGAGGGAGGGVNTSQLAASTTSSGEIVVISAGKIYIKMADGTTKAVALSSGTNVLTGTPTQASALKVGQRVIVDGRAEASGVVAANEVVVTP
jgi:hypothetical protein